MSDMGEADYEITGTRLTLSNGTLTLQPFSMSPLGPTFYKRLYIPEALVGKWGSGGNEAFEITSDGTLITADGASYDISVSGTTVTLMDMNGDEVGSFVYAVSGNGMTITNRTGDATSLPTSLVAKKLTGITLNHSSVKKNYQFKEPLDLTGLVVTANYSNGTSVAVTDYYTDPSDGQDLAEPGTVTVTVTYTDGSVTRTASFTITVADR